MKKNVIIAVLAAVMALGMAACGSDDSTKANKELGANNAADALTTDDETVVEAVVTDEETTDAETTVNE